jgi:hypothetical protein
LETIVTIGYSDDTLENEMKEVNEKEMIMMETSLICYESDFYWRLGI